jgi:hypothetical protein
MRRVIVLPRRIPPVKMIRYGFLISNAPVLNCPAYNIDSYPCYRFLSMLLPRCEYIRVIVLSDWSSDDDGWADYCLQKSI